MDGQTFGREDINRHSSRLSERAPKSRLSRYPVGGLHFVTNVADAKIECRRHGGVEVKVKVKQSR